MQVLQRRGSWRQGVDIKRRGMRPWQLISTPKTWLVRQHLIGLLGKPPLGLETRTTPSAETLVFKLLCMYVCMYVQSCVEYCSHVWEHSSHTRLLDEVEAKHTYCTYIHKSLKIRSPHWVWFWSQVLMAAFQAALSSAASLVRFLDWRSALKVWSHVFLSLPLGATPRRWRICISSPNFDHPFSLHAHTIQAYLFSVPLLYL